MNRPNQQIVVDELPQDTLAERHFRLERGSVGDPLPGEVVCRTVLLSIDPANRAWLQASTYREQVRPGDVMAGFTLGEVVAQNGTDIAVGTVVAGDGGWQEYARLPAEKVQPIPGGGDLVQHLGLLGITGLTAYFGLLEIGRPQPGQTVLVSAAAGATGSIVGQLARVHGCRVVGVTGSDAKNCVLEQRLGFDATVNHRAATFAEDLKRACPDGVDIYFDNVGGPVLAAALRRMNTRGRIVCSGVVSQYDTGSPAPGPAGVPGLLVTKRLRMEGLLVFDFESDFAEARSRLADWARAGELIELHEVIDGLDKAPAALIGLLAGENLGKRIVRVGLDPH